MLELFTPRRETWLFRVNPALKFAFVFVFLIIVLFNQNFQFALNQMVLYGLILYCFSGYSWRKLLLFSIPIIVSFFSSAVTMMLFGKGTSVLWSWGLIKISEESIQHGLLLGFKTASFGFLSWTFLLTSRPILLFYALMQQFRMPSKFAYSFIASVRLMPIIVEELQTRANALKVRGVHFSKGLKGVLQRLQLFTVPLFAQSIRRAQRVAVAMEAKRFQMGAKRTYFYSTSYSKVDAVFVAFSFVAFSVAYLLSKGY
ncbi:energy-coupling factor transporter transmembrane component T [Bacillus sp. FJAT-50079]|uniref:energy-coupling factor transporter transmembrane component T family protein n=1 Tax=Bacillus sp. FJAT-50079 TaxID=2833577 RepID=UPI001BCA62B9|nr:energy-coupling factor transporter transmembrane component T [Bacillus sp. FJAT-50079]MBS4207053.1 energy-coupling factor transporter transmembrane protein EcfT [Bacillus sp. FJAT-50079]